MFESGRAAIAPVDGFETTYSKRLKTRFNTEALKRVTTPSPFKSSSRSGKSKLKTQFETTTVSTKHTTLTPDNPGVNCPNQGLPGQNS